MDDVISKLTAEQALKIVERPGRKGGKLREAVLTETMNVLTEINLVKQLMRSSLFSNLSMYRIVGIGRAALARYTSPDESGG